MPTAPAGQNRGLLREKSSRAHAGAERSATAAWELQAGSGYHGNTRLFLKPRTRTQLPARPRVLGRVTALLAQQPAAPAARRHDQNRVFNVVVFFNIQDFKIRWS